MADSTYGPKTYVKDNGDTHVIANGGKIQVESGGDIQYQAGSKITPPTVADVNTRGGIPVVHRIDIADAASADTDVVLENKTRVLDVQVVKTGGAGAASNTITVKNGATAITDAIDMNVADKVTKRAGTIDDAQHEIAAAGTLRVSSAKSGGNCACTVYVYGLVVA